MSCNLYNSNLCRFCAEPNNNGISLSAISEEGIPHYELINKYLPLKVEDDGKWPQTLCSGCHIHLRNTVTFIELIIKGQALLQKLCKRILSEGVIEGDSTNIPNTLSLNGINQKIYDESHGIRAQLDVAGIQPPKRKRGRPRKDEAKTVTNNSEANNCTPGVETHPVPQTLEPIEERDEEESPPDGKRRRKQPLRYLESIQGKELEKVFHENGVTDDGLLPKGDDLGEPGEIEVIGLVQNNKGESLGEFVRCKRSSDPQMKKKFLFRCDICHSVFSQETKFVEHVARHKSPKLKCSQCDEVFETSKDLESHSYNTGHDNTIDQLAQDDETVEKPAIQLLTGGQDAAQKAKSTCPVCQKTFKFALSLKTHMKAEHDDVAGVYPCDICGKKLKYMSSIIYHKETEHSIGTKFICCKCNMTFKHRRLLQKHQYIHGENGKVDRQGNTIQGERTPGLNCPDCGKFFKSKAYLKIHTQFHGNNKTHVCEICNASFQHRSALMLHRRLHSDEKPFQCYFCNKMFSQKGNLNEHMRIHTGEKPFLCEICGRIFATSSQRRLHLKRHIGEKPFECEICQKAFLHKDVFLSHMRRHTGERPYQCEKCKKTFTELAAVRKHVRIHTGEKPFVCNICGKAFSDSSNLNKHKKTHSKGCTDTSLLVSDILPDGLTVNDLALVDSSDEKQFWAVVKQTSDSQDDKDLDQQQVIYITYNDPDDPNSKVSEALIVKKEAVGDKDDGEIIVEGPEEEIIASRTLMATTNEVNTNNSPNLSPTSSQQVLQGMTPLEGQVVMDEHGNPLRFTTADGGIFQVTTIDGESLQLTGSDGSSMPVRITTADGETLTPAGLNISSMVGDVVEDSLVSAAVESLELVSTADVRLLSEAALEFLPLT
uniref:Zinc finger protein 879 n=2 Tax=Lygus hesperus TaxID=30085 RepID=A0A146LKQ8_LYGHE